MSTLSIDRNGAGWLPVGFGSRQVVVVVGTKGETYARVLLFGVDCPEQRSGIQGSQAFGIVLVMRISNICSVYPRRPADR